MIMFLSLLRMLGGNLESKEVEKPFNSERGLSLFRKSLLLWIENSCCSVSVSRF